MRPKISSLPPFQTTITLVIFIISIISGIMVAMLLMAA